MAHDKLPADFAKIPNTHPRALSWPPSRGRRRLGARIDNSIPQTAEVSRATAKYQAAYDGAPQFQPIDGTALQYAVNTPDPVIQVDAKSYYALKDGVWFMAAAPMGPWTVAASVPAAIYAIPVSSPLHYVTYVQVYGPAPDRVRGLHPGVLGRSSWLRGSLRTATCTRRSTSARIGIRRRRPTGMAPASDGAP